MLIIRSETAGKFCDGISRRDFLAAGSVGLGALTLTDLCRLKAQGALNPRATPKSIIMVYLFGGPSHIDMYDMKPDAPAEYRGLFMPRQTNVPGMQICELMPRQAQIADKFAIVRNMTYCKQRVGDHHAIHVYGHDGRNSFPAFGSILSKLWTDAGVTRTLPGPSYVALDNYDSCASFLGPAHKPFVPAPVPTMPGIGGGGHPHVVPVDNLQNLELLPGLTLDRLQDRTALLRNFDTMSRELDGARNALAVLDASQTQALAMLTDAKVRTALDISREPLPIRESYGKVPQLLLARRLVEAGVPLVQLTINGHGHQLRAPHQWLGHAQQQLYRAAGSRCRNTTSPLPLLSATCMTEGSTTTRSW